MDQLAWLLAAARRARALHPVGIGYRARLVIVPAARRWAGARLLTPGARHDALVRFSRDGGPPEPLLDAPPEEVLATVVADAERLGLDLAGGLRDDRVVLDGQGSRRGRLAGSRAQPTPAVVPLPGAIWTSSTAASSTTAMP